MKVTFTILISLLLLGCSEPKKDRSKTISLLIDEIDSLESIHKFGRKHITLVDSLYSIDSLNTFGLTRKINHEFNARNDSLVIRLFNQLFDSVKFSYCNLYYGLSLERSGLQDSANKHYRFLLENNADSILNGNLSRYEVLAILYGKDSALTAFKQLPESNDYWHLFTRNNLENYMGQGMNEFIWFPIENYVPLEYYALVPDSLFKTGKINGMHKLEKYFVERGVNIYNIGTDTKNQAYEFSSKPQYQEKISAINSLIITKTN
ncbi:MAG: hypothetical protein RIC80_17520 [Cyclobacteriaceae bacterium]